MLGISWGELAVIAVLALIVIGPKDLPRILRTLGQWSAKARKLANEFQRGIDQMAREAGVDDVKRHIQTAANLNPTTQIKKAVVGAVTQAPAAAPKSNGSTQPTAAPSTEEPAGTEPAPRA